MAELFTGDIAFDVQFTNALGLNALIREVFLKLSRYQHGHSSFSQGLNASNAQQFSEKIFVYGGPPVGSLSECENEDNVRRLVPSSPFAMFMDVTHDNPPPNEKVENLPLISNPFPDLVIAVYSEAFDAADGASRNDCEWLRQHTWLR